MRKPVSSKNKIKVCFSVENPQTLLVKLVHFWNNKTIFFALNKKVCQSTFKSTNMTALNEYLSTLEIDICFRIKPFHRFP